MAIPTPIKTYNLLWQPHQHRTRCVARDLLRDTRDEVREAAAGVRGQDDQVRLDPAASAIRCV
jgi:hypothetical protein